MFIVCSIVCITDQNLVGRLLKNEELDVCPILVWGLIVCPQTQGLLRFCATTEPISNGLDF